MLSRLVVAGLCAVLFTSAVLAPPPARAAEAAAEKSPTAPRGKPSKRALEYAERYARAVSMDKTVVKLMELLMPMAVEAEAGKRPGLTEKERAALRDAALESSRAMTPRFVELLVEKMAEVYGEDELRALAEFYESPIGRSISAKEDAVSKASEAAAVELVPELATDMVDRLCRKIDCKASTARPSST